MIEGPDHANGVVHIALSHVKEDPPQAEMIFAVNLKVDLTDALIFSGLSDEGGYINQASQKEFNKSARWGCERHRE